MSLLALVQAGCLVVLAVCLIAAGWQDLRTRRIADGVSVTIVATFAAWTLAGLCSGRASMTMLGLSAGCAAIVFMAAALAFAARALGGGDVKLLAATSLFAGPVLMGDLLMVTALAGGALGLASLAGAPIGPEAAAIDGTSRARWHGELPYGPAIAAGGLWVAAALAMAWAQAWTE